MTKFDEKSLRVIEFLGKKSDWKVWSRRFLAQGSRKGYKDLFVGKTKVPTTSEYDAAVALPSQTAEYKNY